MICTPSSVFCELAPTGVANAVPESRALSPSMVQIDNGELLEREKKSRGQESRRRTHAIPAADRS
jgi:hypothetical protein